MKDLWSQNGSFQTTQNYQFFNRFCVHPHLWS